MEKVWLGRTNLKVSRVGIGGIPIQRPPEQEAIEVIRHALDQGINLIDTSIGYGESEIRIGKAIAGRRDDVIIITRTGATDGKRMKEHLERSMKQLQTDFIDIYEMHNIQVAAESMGLGTCYIGLILETDNKKLLGLPEYTFAAGMLSLGYPDKKPDLRKRLPLEAIVHKNRYQPPSDEKKQHWNEELGVNNNAQYITKTVYTVKRLKEWGNKILANIKKAGYEL